MDSEKKKQQIKRLYDQAFPQDKAWNDWFFANVYKDEEALVIEDNDKIVSSLCLQRYDFAFHGATVPFGYVSGALTDYKVRHHGYMSLLLRETVRVAYERGDVFIGLIPADRRLFFLYDKFQFATVVYADIERYTSLHTFVYDPELEIVEPSYSDFCELVRQRSATVLYSNRDYDNIVHDIVHDGGVIAMVKDKEGRPQAMAFAVENGDEIHVKEVLGVDTKAIETALGAVKDKLAIEKPMAVWRLPSGREATLRARGMIRVVNVSEALRTLGMKNPHLSAVFRVSDPLIEANNGIFRVKDGLCEQVSESDFAKKKHIDFDVTIDVLAKILFSGRTIGNILNLPTSHPVMSLMLD